jgi:hypothetical protein
MFNKLLSNAGLRPKLHVPLTFTSALRLDGNRLDRNTGGSHKARMKTAFAIIGICIIG